MKHLTLFVLTFFTINFTNAQVTKIDSIAIKNLNTSAKKMVAFFQDKNYTEFVKFIHPKFLKMIGGNEKMDELLKKTMRQQETHGFTFKSVATETASKIIKTVTELQAVVPEILELGVEGGVYLSKSYLIAISSDKGKTWYFIDTSGKPLSEMQKLLPNLSNKLTIPAKEEAVFHPDSTNKN